MTAKPRCATRSIGPLEALELAAGAASAAVAASGSRPAGAAPFGDATAARWDLHGVLAPLADADLDADPGGGEWTIRQTLAHIVYVQRAYPAFASWWLSREQTPELPASIPDGVDEGFPEEEAEGVGTLAEIRGRLDDAMDGASERMAGLDEAQLATPARWSGYAVDVGFRLGRMSSHLQEHTVQVDKTLVMLDRTPPEAHRLVAPGVPRVRPARGGRLRAALEHRRRGSDATGRGGHRGRRRLRPRSAAELGHGLRALKAANAAGTLRAP